MNKCVNKFIIVFTVLCTFAIGAIVGILQEKSQRDIWGAKLLEYTKEYGYYTHDELWYDPNSNPDSVVAEEDIVKYFNHGGYDR